MVDKPFGDGGGDDFVIAKSSVMMLGPPGMGRTHLATALTIVDA